MRRVSIDWIAAFGQRHATFSEGSALNARKNSLPKGSPANVSERERENFVFDPEEGTDRGEFFHPNCFVCSQCRTSLANHSFYHHEKSYLCEKCHIDKAQLCAECQKKILTGEASESFLSSILNPSVLQLPLRTNNTIDRVSPVTSVENRSARRSSSRIETANISVNIVRTRRKTSEQQRREMEHSALMMRMTKGTEQSIPRRRRRRSERDREACWLERMLTTRDASLLRHGRDTIDDPVED